MSDDLHLRLEFKVRSGVDPLAAVMMELSPLELELFLRENLPEKETKTTFFYAVNRALDKVTRSISRQDLLEIPQFYASIHLTDTWNGRYTWEVEYNPFWEQRLSERFAALRANGEFYTTLQKNRAWVVEKQKEIIAYLCPIQYRYLQTENPLNMQHRTQQDVANSIGCDESAISRLTRTLTVHIYEKNRFVTELIPGAKLLALQGTYALQQLQRDPTLFDGKKWLVSDRELAETLHELYQLSVARRTVAKYRGCL
ncbi:hypothetical protein HZC31_02700 [Candidatus Woesearchaeota archaeon]|nr:hypothetical protein [Candidatus Woesearchaeota archaeon]